MFYGKLNIFRIAHHDDFAQILAQLNEGRGTKATNDDESGESQATSIQKQAKKSTRRIQYELLQA